MAVRLYPVLLGILIVTAGCSRGTEPVEQPPYDSSLARTTLVSALDSWKKGDARTLVKRKPPIRFVDDDSIAGLRLVDYEIEEPDAPIELHKDVSVILSLRDQGGKVIRREARYQVATSPGLAVLRSDR
jgi:hypothetical protein